ncbi:DNA-binding NtrC family response regulator [Aureibacter tunicatorum]|uniref:DNA-binding NtrC family response regulator n=2 Tax=Aureibacter tunicatorum TaxID=866807 RepID=A0AAE3XJG8_9BACT|nr:DNA-binding NtrC family response regulator [Aureibacter tunicatorum]BDD06261.1 sigma-54-dependent Fis family transcriptional regulator [Aureibacter tunicatorum]
MAADKVLGRILMVDDDEDVLFAGKMLLKKHAQEVTIEKNPQKIPFLLNNYQYDLILLDMNYTDDTASGKEGIYWLEEILDRQPNAKVVMITAFGDVELAVKSLKIGAMDFVVKPWENAKLIETLKSAQNAESMAAKQDVEEESQEEGPMKGIVGSGESLREIFSIIDKIAGTDANVLILGENGTGKELIAKAIHERSKRKEKVFVNVDMGAITESLFESELFGHKKGSFTDAHEDRKGRFELAHDGTLFLDEIGNLSLPLQAKLLTALQRRKVSRVGDHKEIDVNIRLIAATNGSLHEMVEDKTFRQDLLYRLNTVEIRLPALRERKEDIEELAKFFVKRYCKKYDKKSKQLQAGALAKLEEYAWPGNVRELQHAIERSVIMCEDQFLRKEDFSFLRTEASDRHDMAFDNYNLEEIERKVIQEALDKYKGNISKASRELGITRAALYRRLEKHGI